jgi:hypothetical protein
MTRDELEAVIRQQLARSVAEAMVPVCSCTVSQNRATEAILKAADAYGLTEFGMEAVRRRMLLAETVGDGSYGGRAS